MWQIKRTNAQMTPIQHMMENSKHMARNTKRIFCPLEPVCFATIPKIVGQTASGSCAPTDTVCLVSTPGYNPE